MQHSHPSHHGASQPSSRRRSPVILDPAQFSAAQTQDWPYEPTRNSTTTVTANGQYYQSTMHAGYSYAPQVAESSYHTRTAEYSNYTQTVVPSSRYQDCSVYPDSTQPHQQTSPSHRSASTVDGISHPYYDSLAQTSISYTSGSVHQNSTGSSQSAPGANSISSETQASSSKSTTRHPKDSNPDMNSKMGRWRLGRDGPVYPPSRPFVVGELKRKGRASSPQETGEAEAVAKRKAKSAERSRNGRTELSEDIAKLTERLPPHLRHDKDKPSRKNVGGAVIYIDEQNARIGRLENEIAQYNLVQSQLTSEIFVLRGKNYELMEINEGQRLSLAERDKRIRQLEGRQTLQ